MKEALEIVELLLPTASKYHQSLVAAWLIHHGHLVTASSVRMVYRYLLEQIPYRQLLNHFRLDLDGEEKL